MNFVKKMFFFQIGLSFFDLNGNELFILQIANDCKW